MKQYQDLLENITSNGVEKQSARANMPNTIGLSFAHLSFNLQEGFPLLTTKKMFYKGIIHELLWFIRGDTNIKYLVDNGVKIWNQDAYKWYLKYADMYINGHPPHKFDDSMLFIDNKVRRRYTLEEFMEKVKEGHHTHTPAFGGYCFGDLGKVYGYQWRNQNGVDQLADVVKGLKENPYSRYHIIDGWNKADFSEMALPPCHLLYQFTSRPKEEGGFFLDLNMYQRSCDTFLGVPFNIASASLFLMIIAKASGMEAGVFNWIGGDTHLYVTHEEQIEEQLSRRPFDLPKMHILPEINSLEDIEKLTIDDFLLKGYECHPPIKAELSVGLKTK